MAYTRLLTCAACGTQNRIPARYLASTGRCGNCKGALAPLGFPLDVDEAGFDAIVGAAKVPVLVDFWAEWCGPCKMAAPEVKELAREMAGKAIVLKVDTDANQALGARFRVQSIPNFMVFKEGQVVKQQAGVVPRAMMRGWLEVAS
jgi:thioredoxin 2